jgi:hypothetical protein
MRLASISMLAAGAALLAPATTWAQPEPSFRASCAELRAAIAKLGRVDDALVTIQVEGALTRAHFDGALAYLVLCEAPHPQVLCVTYSTGGRKAGDRVAVVGAFQPRGPDHVMLDPCLPAEPER